MLDISVVSIELNERGALENQPEEQYTLLNFMILELYDTSQKVVLSQTTFVWWLGVEEPLSYKDYNPTDNRRWILEPQVGTFSIDREKSATIDQA